MDWMSPRRCRSIGPLVFLAFLCGPPQASLAQDAEPPQVRVARLITDLGDRDFTTRRSAFDRLARLGSESRVQLERALSDSDPEVRLRAGQLLERLKVDELWSASRVTYQAKAQPASKVLAELARQSGNHIHVGDPYGTFAEAAIDMDFVGLGYWEAIDQICRQTKNRVRPHYDMHTPGIVVSSGSPGEFPRAYAGPVRALITSAKRHFVEELNYETGKSELSHSFHVNVQFNWEDRFRIVGYATQPELVEGVTDNHVIISAAQPSGGGWNATSRGLRQVTANLKLNPIPVSATTLKTFTIRWGLIAVGEPATIEITDFSPERDHTGDDVVVRIDSLEAQVAGKYVLTLNILRDLALPDPFEVVFREYDVELIDKQGVPFRIQSQTPALTDRGVQIRITYHGESTESEPKVLKVRYPRLRAKRDLHLTFSDVPLPAGKPE